MQRIICEYSCYPLVFVDDPNNENVEVPETGGKQPVYSTASCIGVATDVPDHDEVEYILAHESESTDEDDLSLAFRGTLQTPSKEIMVYDVDEEFVLRSTTENELTNVVIFTNDPTFPTKVLVKYS